MKSAFLLFVCVSLYSLVRISRSAWIFIVHRIAFVDFSCLLPFLLHLLIMFCVRYAFTVEHSMCHAWLISMFFLLDFLFCAFLMAFTALTLLAEHQEWYPTCKKSFVGNSQRFPGICLEELTFGGHWKIGQINKSRVCMYFLCCVVLAFVCRSQDICCCCMSHDRCPF